MCKEQMGGPNIDPTILWQSPLCPFPPLKKPYISFGNQSEGSENQHENSKKIVLLNYAKKINHENDDDKTDKRQA